MAQEFPLALLKYVTLKNRFNNKHLRFTEADTQQHGFLQFTGEEAINVFAKFEIEQSKTVRGMVHIRCTYNNKYWVRTSPTQMWIAAAADIPEEDQSKWSCTLFRPEFVAVVDNLAGGRNNLIRFSHAQLGQYVGLYRNSPYANFAYAASRTPNPNMSDVCEVVDWDSLIVLPRHIAFKGENKMFLRARVIQKKSYLEFSGTDNGEAATGHEVFTNPDGSIRIKSNHYGKFWKRSSDGWIWGDSSDTTPRDPNTVFWPLKESGNVVALRNLGNNRFCKRLTADKKTSCLSAVDTTVSEFARLEVQELVLSRRIYNVDFRLLDARIYNQSVSFMGGNTITNNTAQTNTSTVTVKYADTRSRNWQSSVSFKYGLKSTFSVGLPVITDGTIEIGWEAAAEYTWGETTTSSQEVVVDYTVTVAPYTRATVRLLGTQGTCDVPFSYTQADVLFGGKPVTERLHDGLYTGVNFYNFTWENSEEKLTAEEIKLAQLEEEEKAKLLNMEKKDQKLDNGGESLD